MQRKLTNGTIKNQTSPATNVYQEAKTLTSRFGNLKLKTINCLHKYYFDSGMKYYFDSQIISFLKSKKGQEENEIIKIKNNLVMRLLFIIIFNINEHNAGTKSDLLAYIDYTIYTDPKITLTAFPLEIKLLREIKDLIKTSIVNNSEADFLLPPDMNDINMVRKIYIFIDNYYQKSSLCSAQELTVLQSFTLNVLKILLFPENNQNKLSKLEDFRKEILHHNYGSNYVPLLDKILEPYASIKSTFFFLGAGESSKDLSTIVMDYYDEATPEMTFKSK